MDKKVEKPIIILLHHWKHTDISSLREKIKNNLDVLNVKNFVFSDVEYKKREFGGALITHDNNEGIHIFQDSVLEKESNKIFREKHYLSGPGLVVPSIANLQLALSPEYQKNFNRVIKRANFKGTEAVQVMFQHPKALEAFEMAIENDIYLPFVALSPDVSPIKYEKIIKELQRRNITEKKRFLYTYFLEKTDIDITKLKKIGIDKTFELFTKYMKDKKLLSKNFKIPEKVPEEFKTVRFLGFDGENYSLKQEARIFSCNEKDINYWQNKDMSVVQRVKNILGADKKNKNKQQTNIAKESVDDEKIKRVLQRRQRVKNKHALSLLIDISGSTGNKANKKESILGIEKKAAYVLGEAANILGDELAAHGFTCKRECNTADIYEIKSFSDAWGRLVKSRLGALCPFDGTPLSIAIRAITKEINNRTEANKMMFVFTDGEPNCGSTIEDTRKAFEEAKQKGIFSVFVQVGTDQSAKYAYEQISPSASYALMIDDINQLPDKVFKIYLKKRKI